jgi:YbbR domain-containing protein
MTNRKTESIFSHRFAKWLVLGSILVALTLIMWPGATVHKSDIFVPIEFSEIPAGMMITGPRAKGIEVSVQGPKSTIEALSKLKVQYLLDLSNVDVGVKTITIDQSRLVLPRGISITAVNPEFLTIKVENEIKKEMPVSISFAGKPASGFRVTGAVAKPLSVLLKGPENRLGPMVKVMTKPVDIKGLSESFKKEIALELAEDLEIISTPTVVLAEIFIEEKIVTRSYHNIPVKGKDTPYTYSITPRSVDIEVKGPLNVLEKLHSEKSFNVYVDLKGLKPGVYVRRVAITLPVKSTLVSAEPEVFTVKLHSP